MDHPNIAKIFDGGTTSGEPGSVSAGRPYFVMELVKGVPITDYCNANRLPTGARLELFNDVCSAVQHAHQKGIIHRDIKPSNVMVVSHDGTPVVKVIDFGVAKAVGQQLTDKSVYTQFAQMVGTPLYMSPEQAGQSGLDVDTRTDVYALGVLLFELLTGTTPFEKVRLHQAGYDEMRRIIREEEPPKPSARLSTMHDQMLSTLAEQRNMEPRKLSQQMRGELDWIVMKALEKDRNRRYESASTLAADVQRYLQDEPVEACPPSLRYRLGKFLRKHRTGVLMAAVLLTAALVLPASIGYVLLDRADRLAEIGHKVSESLASARTAIEAGDLNLALKPIAHAEAYLETVRERLPSCDAEINRVRLAIRTRRASKWPQEVAAARKALEFDTNNVVAWDRLAYILYVQQKFPEGEAAYRKLIVLDSEDAHSWHGLSNVLYLQQRLPEAEAVCRKAIYFRPRVPNAYNTLAQILRGQQKLPEADDAERKALDLGQDRAIGNFTYLLMEQGRFAEALACFKRAIGLWYRPGDELRQTQEWVQLDDKLPMILKGQALPTDAAESFAWAEFCQLHCRQCYAASARFYGQTFADDPTLVDDLRTDIRYDAARAAALAGCAQGKDAAQLEAKEYARLRRQALTWLRADLAGWRQELDSEPAKTLNGVRYEMQQWQQDASFAGVRGEEALAKLPEAERHEWQKLWEEVNELRRKAAMPSLGSVEKQ